MPHTDQILARADPRPPPAFACTATHGGLDAAWVTVVGELDIATAPVLALTLHESQQLAHLTVLDLRELAFMDSAGVHTIVNASLRARKNGRRLVLVRGRPAIYRMFTLTSSTADVDIADPDPVQPPVPALQRSLVSESLLRTGATARHRGPSH
jgi:anti-sigma B factor antagonist